MSELNGILNRKVLKSFIMIASYNACLWVCFESIKQALIENDIVIDSKILYTFCKVFFKFLNDDIFKYIYINSKCEYLDSLKFKIKSFDNSSIDLTYLNFKIKKEEIKFNKKRWIFTKKQLIDGICYKKTIKALNANVIQSSDAELVRFIIGKMSVLTVHDSFAVNLFDLHVLVDLINLFFNDKLSIKSYGLFIVL
jgi:hypothetical protein